MAKKYRSEAFAAIHETMEALHDIGAVDKQTKPSSVLDDHPAAVSAISTSAGMPRLLCSRRIMASVSGRLRLRTS